MKKSFYLFLFISLLFTAGAVAQHTTYTLQKGETLEQVAEKFEVTKEQILKLNPDLKRGDLENRTIILPPNEASQKTPKASMVRFKEYKVKKKETLYSLAKRYNISVNDIKKYNPYLYDDPLGEGDMIKIPIYEKEIKSFNKSVQNSTFENLVHIVMPKETKYGISKTYGMTIEELDSLNPLVKELQPGQYLRVKNPLAKKENVSKYDYYEVQPKETFYSLTRKLEISQDLLEELNPILKELGLQAGMELRIPNGSGGEDFEGLTDKIDLGQKIKTPNRQKAVIMLPFGLNQLDALKQKDSKEEGDDDDNKDAISEQAIIKKDSYMQMSLDLYSGIRMALDSVQRMGISVEAEVFDTKRNPAEVNKILNQNNFKDVDVVVGPLLTAHIEQVATKLKHQKTAVFSPLSSGDLKGSDKIFQTRPSASAKEHVLKAYLKENREENNLLLLGSASKNNFVKQLQNELSGIRMIHQKAKDYLQKSDLTAVLSKDRPNWIIIESDDLGAISNAITNLNAVRNDYEVRIFTSDKSQIDKADVESEFLSNLNFTYTSIDRSDTAQERDPFVRNYLKKYGILPSSYATRGFDVTLDALLRSAYSKDLLKSTKKLKGYTEYVENRFDYRTKSADGFYNQAVYLIKFDEDLKLKVLN